MEKGLDHEMLGSFYSVFTIFILFFHVVYNLILAKYFFCGWFWYLSFFQELSYCCQNSSVCQKILKKKQKQKTSKQTNKHREVFPNSLLQWPKTILKNAF